MRNKLRFNSVAAIVCFSLTSVAQAATITLTASGDDRGAFNSDFIVSALAQPWKVVQNSFLTRAIGTGADSIQATRNYHLFSIPNLAPGEVITGAELRITHPSNSYDSPDATETVTLYDVSTAGSVLRNPDDTQALTVLADIFDDLGGGTVYGSFEGSLSDNGTVESILLNADALSALNLAAGSEWGIGGAITTNGGTTAFGVAERVLRGTGASTAATELVLTTAVVPVPAAVWLFGSGLLGLVGVARRRSALPKA